MGAFYGNPNTKDLEPNSTAAQPGLCRLETRRRRASKDKNEPLEYKKGRLVSRFKTRLEDTSEDLSRRALQTQRDAR